MKQNNPQLLVTTNYGMFDLHPCNRAFHDDPKLFKSMQTHGFMPSSPIQCCKNGGNRLLIIRGHHRYEYAKKLKLPIYYVIDNTQCDIFELEGSSKPRWSSWDFATARACAGDGDCKRLVGFVKKYKIPMRVASAMLAIPDSPNGHQLSQVKRGTFHIADTSHALRVVQITDFCAEQHISFARQGAFVSALSLCLNIPDFDESVFINKIVKHGSKMKKRGTMPEYLEEIEALYNHATHSSHRLNVAFKGMQLLAKRNRH